jgi:hypothetical protein
MRKEMGLHENPPRELDAVLFSLSYGLFRVGELPYRPLS